MHQARIVKAFWFDFISFETFLLRARPHQTKSYSSMSCIGNANLAFSVAQLMMAGDGPFLLRNDAGLSHELRSVPPCCNYPALRQKYVHRMNKRASI